MSYSEDRRADRAQEAEQRRIDAAAADERKLTMQAAADKRRRDTAAADQASRDQAKRNKRREQEGRRKARAARRQRALQPANLYSKGTNAVVLASIAASLPAQFIHFVGISWTLMAVPIGVEGAAWVAAAGVRYADEMRLPGWVRWMLRAICLAAASFAAFVNFGYGSHIAPAAGYGLAAVSLLGPFLFELRQWVTTIAAVTLTPKEQEIAKAKAEHAKKRGTDHEMVTGIASRLVSAAPYGSLTVDKAFPLAWEIVHGTPVPGMTPGLHAQRGRAKVRLEKVLADSQRAIESVSVDAFLADVFPVDGGLPEASPQDPANAVEAAQREPSGDGEPEGSPEGAERRTALSGKGFRRSPKTDERPLAEDDLEKVRMLAVDLGGVAKLSTKNIAKVVGGCRHDYAARLRDAVRAEFE